MKTKTMEPELQTTNDGLFDLYVDQLKDLYSAEQQLVKALPKMVKAASSPALKSAFEEHLNVTHEHVSRLEEIFNELNKKPGGVKCEAMLGLIKEGEEVIKKKGEDPVIKDADLIAAAQRVEHYEMAGYGVVRTFAKRLGFDDAVVLLQQTLDEEGAADKTLTAISENLLSNGQETLSQ